jgi:Lrp/AsnC family leucine-responsive transcriptional regulator
MQDRLDKKDQMIIEYLKDHGRDKISEISNTLGIPRATVFERMERLRKEGYIKKYTVDLDYEKLGYPVMAYVLITFNFHAEVDQMTLCRTLSKMDNVVSASVISGNWDIMILTINKNMKELSQFVLDKLRTMDGVERTLSVPVFELVK